MSLINPKIFLFHGAPDIIFRQTCAIVSSGSSGVDSGSTSEDDVLKVAHQRNQMKSALDDEVPEKMGQAIAALHFLLVAKALRRIHKKSSKTALSASALLLDRMSGGIICKGTTTVSSDPEDPSTIAFTIKKPPGEILTWEALCRGLQLLLNTAGYHSGVTL